MKCYLVSVLKISFFDFFFSVFYNNSKGPTFSTLLAPTITLIYSCLLDEGYEQLDEYRSMGRVVHSIVQALGPELGSSGTIMTRCNALAADLRVKQQKLQFFWSAFVFKQKQNTKIQNTKIQKQNTKTKAEQKVLFRLLCIVKLEFLV